MKGGNLSLDIIKKFNQHKMDIETIETTESALVVRFREGVSKLESIRKELLDEGYGKPISCHRDFEASSCFMMLWYR